MTNRYTIPADRWQPAEYTQAGLDALDDCERDFDEEAYRLTLAECRELCEDREAEALDFLQRALDAANGGSELPSWATHILGWYRDTVAEEYREAYLEQASQCLSAGMEPEEAGQWLDRIMREQREAMAALVAKFAGGGQ